MLSNLFNRFNSSNYPKQFASIDKNKFRLDEYLHYSNKDLMKIENDFYKFVETQVRKVQPLRKYLNYEFLNSGWEWSAFIYDDLKVIKIPSGIFDETEDIRYLENIEKNYLVFQKLIGSKYIAQTHFEIKEKQNILLQERIHGYSKFNIDLNNIDPMILNTLYEIFAGLLKMKEELEWIPDLPISFNENSLIIENIILSNDKSQLKFIDFSSYHDVFRLYPARQKFELKSKGLLIELIYNYIESRLKNKSNIQDKIKEIKHYFTIEKHRLWEEFTQNQD